MTRGLVEAARRAARITRFARCCQGRGWHILRRRRRQIDGGGQGAARLRGQDGQLRRGMKCRAACTRCPSRVAQLDGAAAGAGLSIALSCDLRVASASCKIRPHLPRSDSRAITAALISDPDAWQRQSARTVFDLAGAERDGGLQSRHGDKGGAGRRIDAEAQDLAMSLAQGPSVTLGYIKRNINNAETMSLEACSTPKRSPFALGRYRRSQGGGKGFCREAQARRSRWRSEMAEYLRLRQICLVAPHLEPVISDISAIMGLNVCYRDGNVAKYGLENALLPVDTILLEVVAPFQPGTAAGRFLDKTGGRGGYMAIFCCDDPDARGKHANGMGVRTANVITHAPYHGVQLHPRDCRAAFIESIILKAATMCWGPIRRRDLTGRRRFRKM